MKLSYKILRALFVLILAAIILIPAILYVVLTLPPVQDKVRDIASEQLTTLLDSKVEIGSVIFVPFNKVTLRNVVIRDTAGDTAAYVRRLGAGVELESFIADERIKITYAELTGLDARLYKSTPESPLNIQSIINALKPKDKNKPPTRFDLRINRVIIRDSRLSYDILSSPHADNKFDPNHILISDFNADIHAPRIKNDDFAVEIKRFAVREQSGLELSDLTGAFNISDRKSQINGLSISMPGTKLLLDSFALNYNGWKYLSENITTIPFNLKIKQGSHISLNDLSPIIPQLKDRDATLDVEAQFSGSVDSLRISLFDISSAENNLHVNTTGFISGITRADSASFDLPEIKISSNGSDISELASMTGNISDKLRQSLASLGNIMINADIHGNRSKGDIKSHISTAQGNIDITAGYLQSHGHNNTVIAGNISSSGINLGNILGNHQLAMVGFDTGINAQFDKNSRKANIEGNIAYAEFKGYRYDDIMVNVSMDNNIFDGSLNITDDNINIAIAGEAVIENSIPTFDLQLEAHNIALDSLNLLDKYPGYRLSASIDARYSGKTFDQATALLTINEFNLTPDDETKTGLHLDHIDIEVDNAATPQHIAINSDLIEGRIEGSYSFASLASSCRDILSQQFPILDNTDEKADDTITNNDFSFNFTILDNNALTDFINSPIKLIHPIYLNGQVNNHSQSMALTLDAPYLQQGYKLIKSTTFNLDIANETGICSIKAGTIMPTKNGDAHIAIDCSGLNNTLDTDVSWNIDRQRSFNGSVSLSTLFHRDNDNSLTTDIDIHKSRLVFNDTTWIVNPANISIRNKHITVNGIDVRRDKQYITLEGEASPDPEHTLKLSLNDVNLDYIFETLAIGNVMFGGDATGTFYASNLYSKEPVLYTPELKVKGLSYNGGKFGDAIIKSQWLPDSGAVTINAHISQPNGCHSTIDGAIFPMKESLDFTFDADKINVQFMQPFMSAFAKDVTGTASGKARLYGTFKLIDMVGDIYAENLRLKIDFTNTYYTATDSIHIRPGNIAFENVRLTDIYGNTARLSGWLKHQCFKRPVFEFNITDADNLLCYDETEKRNPRWYGRIFGNGSASVKGHPGYVGISVDMTTAPKSSFTFVILDSEVANEYSFVTFRDRDKSNRPTSTVIADSPLEKVKQLEAIIAERQKQDESKTQYYMDIHVNARPQAEMIVVMDPAGGDRIKAHGDGSLQLTYDSRNEELNMNGTYTLEDGRYNFTLQDIIIKEFTIKKGSSIAFKKDPFNAILDLTAYYTLNANLSDLDESFLQDKDLNRTNVPVNAVLKATGNMQQPETSFDLEFPTLSQDVYRKVKSIVSTDDMMNRQIIYLLALNRFYTPDYMASTTKGNELLSVATSTISSQLSSMLGELNDNINISPNIRSDKGDFSDVEVDLVLSSSLLNNRLLFNGNFGYRDNSLNNNTFIGDFDIEYLLSKSGHLRLKAYNRYNDQNFYVKTALTTQGVGIVYRRDFDNMFSFLKPIKKWLNKSDSNSREVSLPIDTISSDSIKTMIPVIQQ